MVNNLMFTVVGWFLGMGTFLFVATPTVKVHKITWATDVCTNNGGILAMEEWYASASQTWTHVQCKNGAKFGMNKEAQKQYEQK